MTVAELRLALAAYPAEAEVCAVDGPEVVQVTDVGSATMVLADARAMGMTGAALDQLQDMLRHGPDNVYVLLVHYA